jgi:glycosyltransferase involved in cell wall biosynthesis
MTQAQRQTQLEAQLEAQPEAQPKAQPKDKEIIFLCETFWPVVGGGERHAEELAQRLAAAGWRVRVITRRVDPQWPDELERNGVRVSRVRPTGHGRLAKYRMGREICRLLRQESPQGALLYVCGLRVLGLPAVRIGRELGMPVVLRAEARGELSGEYIWNSPHAPEKTWLKLLLRPFIAWRNSRLRQADCFLAIADVIRDEFIAHGVNPDRIAHIPNGIDLDRFHPVEAATKQQLRRELGLDQDAFYLAYAGKLNRGKGLETLVRAFGMLDSPATRLLLIGSGSGMFLSCEHELRQTIAAQGLSARVHFTGYVENVAHYLQAADAFVFASEMEAFGLAPLEAAACGLPVISTTAGALAQTMEHGRNALTFPVGDAESLCHHMHTLLHDQSIRAELIPEGLRRVQTRYSLDAITAEHARLFSALPARTDRQGPGR